MDKMQTHWAIVDEIGRIYGATVYHFRVDAEQALKWCQSNLEGEYRLVSLREAS